MIGSVHLEERQYIIFGIIIYRWWMKMWKQVKARYGTAVLNVLPIIFENNLGTLVSTMMVFWKVILTER